MGIMEKQENQPVALITGGARRLGAIIARALHKAGYRVVIHYRHSEEEASALTNTLNQVRTHSAVALAADLDAFSIYAPFVTQAEKIWGRLDILINNASTFFPTPCGQIPEKDWDALMNSNLKAPFFLAQAAAAYLRLHKGTIINIADIHGLRPLKNYPIYSIAKSGLIMLTKALARELAPDIRVNAIAPGVIAFPEEKSEKASLIEKTLLKRFASPEDITNAILFLIQQHSMTGEIIKIDCGRSVRH